VHSRFFLHLQALRVVGVSDLAGSRRAAGLSSPADTTALSVQSRASGTAAAVRWCGGRSSTALAGGWWWVGATATSVADGLLRGTTAAPALDGDNLEVVSTEVHSQASPLAEVVLDCDCATWGS